MFFGWLQCSMWGYTQPRFQTSLKSWEIEPFTWFFSWASFSGSHACDGATAMEKVAAGPSACDSLKRGNKNRFWIWQEITGFGEWQFTLQMSFQYLHVLKICFFLLIINCVSSCKSSTSRKNVTANRVSENKHNLKPITEWTTIKLGRNRVTSVRWQQRPAVGWGGPAAGSGLSKASGRAWVEDLWFQADSWSFTFFAGDAEQPKIRLNIAPIGPGLEKAPTRQSGSGFFGKGVTQMHYTPSQFLDFGGISWMPLREGVQIGKLL